MAHLNYDDFFSPIQNYIEPPQHLARYRRGLTISAMLIATILAGGLEFVAVTAGTVGLKVTRAAGMHATVWVVFLYYLYAFWAMRHAIIIKLDAARETTLWPSFAKWVANKHAIRDLAQATGRDYHTGPMSYQSNDEEMPSQKKAGAQCKVRYHFGLTKDELTSCLDHQHFAQSDHKEGWVQHTYSISEEDIQEFDRRRGLALSRAREDWLEYRLPYVAAWILLGVGVILYGSWFFWPTSWLGQVVPLGPP